MLGLRRSSRPLLQSVTLYCLAISCLGFYSLLVQNELKDKETPTATRWAGYLSSLTVVVVDCVVYLSARCHLLVSPVVPLCLMLALRTALVAISIYGEAWLPLLHSAVFVVVGGWLGAQASSHRQRGSQAMDRLAATARRAVEAQDTASSVQTSGKSSAAEVDGSGATSSDSAPQERRGVRLAQVAGKMSDAAHAVHRLASRPHLLRGVSASDGKPEGRWSELSRLPELPLVFLAVVLTSDTLVYASLHSSQPERNPDVTWIDGTRYPQYLYLLGAMFASCFFTLCYRIYWRLAMNGWSLRSVVLHVLVTEARRRSF